MIHGKPARQPGNDYHAAATGAAVTAAVAGSVVRSIPSIMPVYHRRVIYWQCGRI